MIPIHKIPNLTHQQKVMLRRFRDRFYKNAKWIDPNNELDWYSMAIGFFIGQYLTRKEAVELASIARYKVGIA